MRAIILAAFAAALSATTAFAQVDVAKIGPTADRDFWCATALGLYSYALKSGGDAAGSAEADQDMQTLFHGIALQMQTKGMQKTDYDALVEQYTGITMNPFADAPYTQEQCKAAVAEAAAAAPAPEPVPETTPSAPDAPPATPVAPEATPDAPAQ